MTVAGTGTGDLVDAKDTETSDAVNARRFEQNRVTRVPPIVETTEGETKLMEGLGRFLGSKQ